MTARIPAAESYGLIGGRWQPFHKGHEWLLDYACSHFEKVVVGIVNVDPKNPPVSPDEWPWFHPSLNSFSFWERVEMIKRVCLQRNLHAQVAGIVPLGHVIRHGWEDADSWLPPEGQRTLIVPLVRDSEEQRLHSLQGSVRLRAITEFPEELVAYSAATIRAAILNDRPWEHLVPAPVAEYVRAVGGVQRIKALPHAGGAQGVATQQDVERSLSGSQVAVFAGYFQPLHIGHLEAIQYLLQNFQSVVVAIVGVGSLTLDDRMSRSHLHPMNHPLSPWQRLRLVHEALTSLPEIDRVRVVALPFRPLQEHFRYNVSMLPIKRVWALRLADQREAQLFTALRERGEQVQEIPDDCLAHPGLSATQVRERMFLGDTWEDLVPASTVECMKEMNVRTLVRSAFYSFGDQEYVLDLSKRLKLREGGLTTEGGRID